MSSRDWSTARSFGRFMQALHLLQPATQSTLSTDDILFILDVNEIQADGQPKQVSISELGSSIPISAAGLDTQVQFNDGGARAGDSGLTFNKTTNALTAGSFIPTSSTIPSNGLYSPNTNQVALSTNGTGRVEFGTSEVVFNDGGENYDFRVEGDTNSSLFFVDASADKVGIGTTSPGALLDVLASSGDNLCRIGGVGSTKSGFQFRANNISYAEIYFQNSNPYPLVLGTKTGAGPVVFNVADDEKARIDTSGALLIGTTTSSNNARLGVAGSTHIGSGLNTVTLANGATGTVVTPARGYSYVNISINTTTSRGLLLLLFADSTSLSIVSTIDDNTLANYSASVSGRNLQVTNSSGSSVTFYASCLTLTWAEAG